MKLIISLSGLVHKVRITSYDAWIRPVRISVPIKVSRSIVATMASVRIWCQLNELLRPIQENGCNCHIQSIFPIQRGFHKCSETNSQIPHSKEVTPEKFGDLLDIFHRAWSSNHNYSSNLHLQNTIKFIKNIIINVPKLPGFLLKAIFLERINNLKENI